KGGAVDAADGPPQSRRAGAYPAKEPHHIPAAPSPVGVSSSPAEVVRPVGCLGRTDQSPPRRSPLRTTVASRSLGTRESRCPAAGIAVSGRCAVAAQRRPGGLSAVDLPAAARAAPAPRPQADRVDEFSR